MWFCIFVNLILYYNFHCLEGSLGYFTHYVPFSFLRNIGKEKKGKRFTSQESRSPILFCAKFWKNVNKINVTYSTFGEKNLPNVTSNFFREKNHHIFTWILRGCIFCNSFLLLWQFLETYGHLMLIPLGMLTINLTLQMRKKHWFKHYVILRGRREISINYLDWDKLSITNGNMPILNTSYVKEKDWLDCLLIVHA